MAFYLFGYGSLDNKQRAQSEVSFEEEEDEMVPGSANLSSKEISSNIVSLITGSGMLSLPFAARIVGWFCIPLICIVCCVYFYTLHILAETMRYVGPVHGASYPALGKCAFGTTGARLTSLITGIEMTLALISFYVNIGVNANILNENIALWQGVILAGFMTFALSRLSAKYTAYSSVVGISMIVLTVAALLISGLNNSETTSDDFDSSMNYKLLQPSGLPFSVGLISFTLGGHGATPSIYWNMRDRRHYGRALMRAAAVIVSVYIVVTSVGYYYYGQYTMIPITVNIGSSLDGKDLANSAVLKAVASLGIIINLQVTCPLVVSPVTEILLNSLYSKSNSTGSEYTEVGGQGGDILDSSIISDGGDVYMNPLKTPSKGPYAAFRRPSSEEKQLPPGLRTGTESIDSLDEETQDRDRREKRETALAKSQHIKLLKVDRLEGITDTGVGFFGSSEGENNLLMSADSSLSSSTSLSVLERRRISATVVVVAFATVMAVVLRKNLASLSAIVGSLATTTNSLLMPLVFYHGIVHKRERVAARTVMLHVTIVLLAVLFGFMGVASGVCHITSPEDNMGSHIMMNNVGLCHYLNPPEN